MARPLQMVARAVRRRGGEAAIGIEGLYLELAADRARRARVALEGSDAECALAQSAATLEDAAGVLAHAAERYSDREGRWRANSRRGRASSRRSPPASKGPPISHAPDASTTTNNAARETRNLMPNPDPIRYRDSTTGVWHEVIVRQSASGAWEIVDRTPTETRTVDTLTEHGDGRAQAEAIARDYAAQQQPPTPPRAIPPARAGRTRQLTARPAHLDALPNPQKGGPMPDPVTAPQPARASPAGIQGLRCRVRVADGRVFCGDLVPERHRALQLGLLHADSDGLVELAAGARRDGRLQITHPQASRPLPPRRQGRTAAAGCTALLALAATPRRARRGGVHRPRRPRRAARREARRRPHPVLVGRRRPARAAARAVGVPGRAALPPAGRNGRLGRRSRLLAAGRGAARHAGDRSDRRARSSRSSGRTCGSSITSASAPTANRTSPTRNARSGHG